MTGRLHEHSELLISSQRKQTTNWKILVAGIVACLVLVACQKSSLLEEPIAAKDKIEPCANLDVDCAGCSGSIRRRRLPVTPGSAPDCKSCCTALASVLKGESILQVVPRQQQSNRPNPQVEGYGHPPSLSGFTSKASSEYEGSTHLGTEMNLLNLAGVVSGNQQAGPSSMGGISPSASSFWGSVAGSAGGTSAAGSAASTPKLGLSPKLGHNPLQKIPSPILQRSPEAIRHAPPGKSVLLKIPIKEDAQLPPPHMGLDQPENENLIDVFLIRHGESTANEIKEKSKKNEVVEVAYGRKIFAKDLYDGCNQNPLPRGIYPLDCTELLQDARLTEQGLRDALGLYERWNSWAISSQRPMTYEPEDAAVIVSPLRRSAITGLMPFKDVLNKIHVEVEFDFRELQYTLRNGLFAENQCMDYPASLKAYVEELGLEGPTFHYHAERMERQGHAPGEKYVTAIWESDEEHPLAPGCPKNTNHFQDAIQRAAEYAKKWGRKYLVIGTHSYVIKCTNREFSLSQTKGKPDPLNPYYRLGGFLLENGAVERIVWDMKEKHVVGPPKMVWKGISKERYFNRFYWPTPPASPAGRSPPASPGIPRAGDSRPPSQPMSLASSAATSDAGSAAGSDAGNDH